MTLGRPCNERVTYLPGSLCAQQAQCFLRKQPPVESAPQSRPGGWNAGNEGERRSLGSSRTPAQEPGPATPSRPLLTHAFPANLPARLVLPVLQHLLRHRLAHLRGPRRLHGVRAASSRRVAGRLLRAAIPPRAGKAQAGRSPERGARPWPRPRTPRPGMVRPSGGHRPLSGLVQPSGWFRPFPDWQGGAWPRLAGPAVSAPPSWGARASRPGAVAAAAWLPPASAITG